MLCFIVSHQCCEGVAEMKQLRVFMFTVTIGKSYILSIVLKPIITPYQSSPSGLQFYLASFNNVELNCWLTLLISKGSESISYEDKQCKAM